MSEHARVEEERVEEPERDDAHLRDVEPGSGCTEIWEHLSERREAEAGDAEE